MARLLVPVPDHSMKYRIHEDFILTTHEAIYGPPRWTRFIQRHPASSRGFLSANGFKRIETYLYQRDAQGDYQLTSLEPYMEELMQAMPQGTLTALHYCPGHGVDTLLTGLPPDTEEKIALTHCFPPSD